MGQCYSVYLKIKVRDEQGAIKALNEKIALAKEQRVNYSLDKWKEEGVGTELLDDLMRIFLAGWQSTEFQIELVDDFVIYTNCFDASYGWEEVMLDMFDYLYPHCHYAHFEIYPDSGGTMLLWDGKKKTEDYNLKQY